MIEPPSLQVLKVFGDNKANTEQRQDVRARLFRIVYLPRAEPSWKRPSLSYSTVWSADLAQKAGEPGGAEPCEIDLSRTIPAKVYLIDR